MLLKLFLILLIVVGYESRGVPLENPGDNFEKFFAPRIIGGIETHKNYPHMVALVVASDVLALVICGASIISPSFVVSAAHCIHAYSDSHGNFMYNLTGVVGTNDWTSGGVTVHFEHIHMHPEWDYPTLKNDVVVLKMLNELTFNERINMIPLSIDNLVGYEDSYVTGWGYIRPGLLHVIPNYLHLLNTTTISSKDCIIKMNEFAAATGWNSPEYDPKLEICTLHSVDNGNCYGDSGSPLVSRKTNRLIGIVSWARTCALGAPDVYVRISAFIDFINNVINK